jgi:hypothetical protein
MDKLGEKILKSLRDVVEAEDCGYSGHGGDKDGM